MPKVKEEIKHCPFCGAQPTIEKWHGGGPKKVMVHCEDDACKVQPQVTGENRIAGIAAWNFRQESRSNGQR